MSESINESIRLFERYCADDRQAADELFERYAARLTALVRVRMSPKLARRLDAEDIVQSAYRSFFTHAKEDRFALKRGGDLWRLLAAIAMNKLRKQIERHLAAKRDVDAENHFTGTPGPNLLGTLASREPSPESLAALAEEIDTLVHGLDELESQMLSMRLAGYRVEEIAVECNRSERTVRRLFSKVKTRMQTRLDESLDR